MKSINEYVPSGEISKYVEAYWTSKTDSLLEIVPDGTFRFIISQSPLYILGKRTLSFSAGIHLIPILTEKMRIKINANSTIIRCKAFALTGINPASFEIENKLLLNCKTMNFKRHILDSIDDPFETNIVNSIVYELIVGSLKDKFKIDENLRSYVNYILDRQGEVTINEMVDEFNISRQYLHKIFLGNLGLSPKQLALIWKMNSFINHLYKGDSLTGAAIESGYYDQSHCINNFKKLNGVSPKVFFDEEKLFLAECIKNRFNNCYDPRL